MALEAAGGVVVVPEQALHIGDSMSKDYAPVRAVGMHALLLDRFMTADAEGCRRSGAPVLPDQVSVQHWLTTRDPSPAVEEQRTSERD
jgi:FMN phosphatase YigB (HAD superfamily)